MKKVITEFSEEEISQFKQEVKISYEELLKFKNNKDFHKNGFGKGGEYNFWLIKIQKQIKNPLTKKLLSQRIVVGEIQQMGFEYIKSKGKETSTTKLFKKDLDKAFYSK